MTGRLRSTTATGKAKKVSAKTSRSKKKTPTLSRGASTLFIIIALVGGLQALLMIGIEANRWLRSQREISRLEADIRGLKQEAAELEAIIAHKDDAQYREQLARLQGFVYPDENLFVTSPRR